MVQWLPEPTVVDQQLGEQLSAKLLDHQWRSSSINTELTLCFQNLKEIWTPTSHIIILKSNNNKNEVFIFSCFKESTFFKWHKDHLPAVKQRQGKAYLMAAVKPSSHVFTRIANIGKWCAIYFFFLKKMLESLFFKDTPKKIHKGNYSFCYKPCR